MLTTTKKPADRRELEEPSFDVSRSFDNDDFPRVESRRLPSDGPALQLMRADALREVERLQFATNYEFWGMYVPGLPAERQRFCGRIKDHPERSRLERDVRHCGELRRLVARIDAALEKIDDERRRRDDRELREEAEREEREAFAAHEAADRERRFQEFRARRSA